MYKPPGSITGLYREDANLTYQGAQFNPYHDVYRENKPAQSAIGLPADTNDSYEGSVRFPRGAGAVGSGGQDSKVPGGGGTIYPNNPRAYPVGVYAYNNFIGSSQGGALTTGNSTLAIDDPLRVAKTQATMGITGVKGISYVFYWMALEPIAPVGGVHTYDFSAIDLALAEIAAYPGAQCIIRINSGGPSAPNWIMGGGTARLATAISSASPTTSVVLAAGSQTPPNGTVQVYLDGTPGQQEGPFITSGLTGTTFTIDSASANSHNAGTIVEWSKIPANWVNNQSGGWKNGDIVIAPSGTTNALGASAAGLAYVVTVDVPQTSYGTGTSVAANWALFLAANPLCELVQFANGDQMAAPWDATYQANRFAFITELGKRYNGDPRIAVMQMPGGGYLGEMTLHSGDTAQMTIASWLPHGYNDWSYVAVWEAFIDKYALAFPGTLLALDIDEPWGAIGPGGVAWATAVTTATSTSNATATITCASTASIVAGMLIDPDANAVLMGIPTYSYVGSVTDATHFTLSSAQGVGGTATATTATSLTDSLRNGTGANPPPMTFGQYANPINGVNWKVYTSDGKVGVVTANTDVKFTVASWSPSQPASTAGYAVALDVSATTTDATGRTLSFNSTTRVDTVTATNENAVITDASITPADKGKAVSGITGQTVGNRFVGQLVPDNLVGPWTGFFMSTQRASQTLPASKALTGTSATIAHDGNAYNSPGTGIIRRAVAGSNQGGALSSDVYSGGSPVIGYTGTTYPGRIFVQQNGLAETDINTLPASRYRQLIVGSSPNAIGNPNATILHAGNGYQEVKGGKSQANVLLMWRVAIDDTIVYIESYANNIATAGAANTLLLASNIRP